MAEISRHPSVGPVTATRSKPEDFPPEVHESLRQLRAIAQTAKSKQDVRLRRATPDEIALAQLLQEPRHCTAHSGRTGLPCRGHAVLGGTVCRRHGAQYGHVKAARERRLQLLAQPCLGEMYKMAMSPKVSLMKWRAAADLMDRAGIGALVEAKVRASYRGGGGGNVSVKIGFLQTMAPAAPAIEGAIVDATQLLPAEILPEGDPRRDGDAAGAGAAAALPGDGDPA